MRSQADRLILILICSVCILSYTWVSAASSQCAIKNAPSKELLKYMERTENLWAKISDIASSKQCNTNKDGSNSAIASAKQAGSSFIASFNGALDYSNFLSSTEFYIGSIMSLQEVPPSINRDHSRLGSMFDGMKRSYYDVYNKCAQWTVLTDNLSDDPNYTTKGKTISTVLDEILANHINMINFYRETTVGAPILRDYSFILVGDNATFQAAMQQSYGPQASQACLVEGDSWDRIKKAFVTLGSLGGGIESGMQEWENAWEYASTERTDRMTIRLNLDSSSGDMGLSWGMNKPRSDAVMLGLDSFWGQDKQGGVSGFVKNVGDRVDKWVKSVGKMFDDFNQKLHTPQTTDDYLEQYQEQQAVKDDIFDEVKTQYLTTKELMGPENATAELNISTLLSTHIALQEENAKLKPMIKISEQTCNQEGKGKGTCSYKSRTAN